MVAGKVLRQICVNAGWKESESWLKKRTGKALASIRPQEAGLCNVWGIRHTFYEEGAALRFLIRLSKEGKISLPAGATFESLRQELDVQEGETIPFV